MAALSNDAGARRLRAVRPLAFVLVDGLGATAPPHMRGLAAEVAAGHMVRFAVEAARPTWSLPNYATLATGVDPAEHGILSNEDRRLLPTGTLFDRLRSFDVPVALSAFHWWGDLLGRDTFPCYLYKPEITPDRVVFRAALRLARSAGARFVLAHPMGADLAGHLFGGASRAYRFRAAVLDRQILAFASAWRDLHPDGAVLIGADHGMGVDGRHGGDRPEELEMFYHLLSPVRPSVLPDHQRGVRALIEWLMGIEPAP